MSQSNPHFTLPRRQVHLDFHTSEAIEDIGAAFDPEHFVRVLQEAHVNSITLFARCHHGWAYYPSAVAKPHPHLVRPDLLGDQVAACRAVGIETPIYLSVQGDERMAKEHPEWRFVPQDRPMTNDFAGWHPICLSHESYIDYLVDQAVEVIERYQPPGLFFDILAVRDCTCWGCMQGIQAAGGDAMNRQERLRWSQQRIHHFLERINRAILQADPQCRFFHNNGHIARGQRTMIAYNTHLELESLPTGGWGYDHFPLSARYVEPLGLSFLGMTGKFHTSWGEFGGFKQPEALVYECAMMIANGAGCSVGDQLHPTGAIDEDTYRSIAPAYAMVAKAEEYLEDSKTLAEVAFLSAQASEGITATFGIGAGNHNAADDGLSRMLLQSQVLFDVVDTESDWQAYPVLILPEGCTCTPELASKLRAYREQGGRLILINNAGMTPDESAFSIDLDLDYAGQDVATNPSYCQVERGLHDRLPTAPFVIHGSAKAVRARRDEQILAHHVESYFNRHWTHYCSHQHAPPRPQVNPDAHALIQVDERTLYIAHPLCTAYHDEGQPLFKYLLQAALARLLPQPTVSSNLPSFARINLTRQQTHQRTVLHIAAAQPQLRGSNHMQWGRSRKVEVIEDIIPLHDSVVQIRLPERPSTITRPLGGELTWNWDDGVATITLPKIDIHTLVVIQ